MNALVSNGPGYSTQEIVQIAGWLREGDTAKQISAKLSEQRRASVSRSAIIAVVYRNPALKAIGFARKGTHRNGGGPRRDSTKARVGAAPAVRPTGNTSNPAYLPAKMLCRVESPKPEAGFFAFKVPSLKGRIDIPAPVHSVGVRFVDALFDRCRWPLDLSSENGPDMLVCGIRLAPEEESYCKRCRVRSFGRAAGLFAAEAA